jgi:hypothetical protein
MTIEEGSQCDTPDEICLLNIFFHESFRGSIAQQCYQLVLGVNGGTPIWDVYTLHNRLTSYWQVVLSLEMAGRRSFGCFDKDHINLQGDSQNQ